MDEMCIRDRSYHLPDELCLDALEIEGLLDRPEMNPRFITEDSRQRRKMYQSDILRNQQEESYQGTKDEFLETLNMRLTISMARENDLMRASELTVRTHQLNSTGYTLSLIHI